MITFVIQIDKENGIPVNEFTYQAYDAVNFVNWVHANEHEPIYAHCQFVCLEQLQKWEGIIYEQHVPVGTIEFVHTYMEKIGKEIPKPINVPESLFAFAGRRIANGSIDGCFDDISQGGYVFIKSNEKIKDHRNELYLTKPKMLGCYQLSEYILDIKTEFRLFIFNKEIRGVSVYSADNRTLFNPYDGLDKEFCERTVEAYSDSPIAYTLDIGIRENGENLVIECHDFYSCGLYGWDNPLTYMNMLVGWWKQYIRA